MPKYPLALAVALLCLASPAAADSLDVLQGKYAFNWRAEPSREKCIQVTGKLFADFKSNRYRCVLTPVTNTAAGAPARVCTEQKGRKKEYLIFETRRACDEERKTQASNE